jgi:rRNA small subunit pseudouridine methyltransferase Nep1
MTIGQPVLQFKKRKTEQSPGDATVGHSEEDSRKLVPNTLEDKLSGQRLIVVLEKASLELYHGKKGKEILNCDDHKNQIQKSGKDFAHYRPDIVHDCLKTLLDSPLNKAGRLQIYIHTATNVLIEVSPTLRIPRTYKRFAGLMAELVDKHKIRAANSRDILMKVIANPVSQYLPAGGRKIALSVNGKMQSCQAFAKELNDINIPVTISIGAVSTGEPSEEPQFGGEYSEEKIAISNYGLSAAVCCSKICDAFEEVWNIL